MHAIPLRLQLGSTTTELLTNRDELRLTMGHIYRAFAVTDVERPPASMTNVNNGDGFLASVNDREYHFTDFSSAVCKLVNVLATQLLKNQPRNLLLHAATVVDEQHSIIIIGPSGAGKTSVALELVRRGMYYATDEFTAIDGANILPFPRSAVRKYEGPVPTGINLQIPFGEDYRAYMLPDRRVGLQPCPLNRPSLIFLQRVPRASVSARIISPGETCIGLMKQTFDIEGLGVALWPPLWPTLAEIANSAKSCKFEYNDVQRDLDLALNLLRVT